MLNTFNISEENENLSCTTCNYLTHKAIKDNTNIFSTTCVTFKPEIVKKEFKEFMKEDVTNKLIVMLNQIPQTVKITCNVLIVRTPSILPLTLFDIRY